MAKILFTNGPQTGLGGAITNSATTLAVVSSTGFPSSLAADEFFYIAIEDELIKITGMSGLTWTASRGVDGTAGAAHGDGVVVTGVLNKEAMDYLRDSIVIGGGGGTGASISLTVAAFDAATSNGTVEGGLETVYLSDGLYTCFWNGSVWEYYADGQKMTRPDSVSFAWVNQGAASVSTANGGMFLSLPAAAGTNWRLRVKTAPATPYTATAHIAPMALNTGGYGLVFRQSSDSKFAILRVTATGIDSAKYTNETTVSAAYITGYVPIQGAHPPWFRIADNGTSRICSVSWDGFNFITVHSVARTDFLTANQIGFAATSSDATNPVGVMVKSWKEA